MRYNDLSYSSQIHVDVTDNYVEYHIVGEDQENWIIQDFNRVGISNQ